MTPEWARVWVSVGQTALIAWGIWLMRISNQERQATVDMLREEAAMLREQRTTQDTHTEALKEQTATQNAHTQALNEQLALTRSQAASLDAHTDALRRLLEERNH